MGIWHGAARSGPDRLGGVQRGKAGTVWYGTARPGKVWRGEAKADVSWRGQVGLGPVWQGGARQARNGEVRPC